MKHLLLALIQGCLLGGLPVLADPLRVRLNPSGLTTRPDPDYTTWTITNDLPSASVTFGNVSLTLTAPSGSVLHGSQYKLVLTQFVTYFGERMIGEGMSTNTTTGVPLTLTITGLSVGNHTLLSFHNAWDKLPGATNVNVSVNGVTVISNQPQTVRQNNIWTAASSYVTFSVDSPTQAVKFTYTPLNSTSVTDLRAYLNGIEIDTGDVDAQAAFPFPEHTNEHVDADSGSVQATWSPPEIVNNAKYDVYFSDSPSSLTRVSSGQSATSFTFSNISSFGTYFWRLDTVSASGTVTGRVWTFRPRQLAFPGAEGYGRYARGGRGGQIVKVTSLDDYDPAGPAVEGTLRWAVTNVTGARTIIFDVGGVITLTSRLTINGEYITMAGQTAPGKGIAIQSWPMGLSGGIDIIIQHMRVRPGKLSNDTVDGMGMEGSNFAIFDRCSMGWSIDESFSSRSAYNITLQRSMISEPLNVAGHKNYPPGTEHGFAASISGDIGSFHHNLIAHAFGRSWSMAGGLDADANFAGRLDIRNNVVYNFGDRVTDGGAHQVNFVSNYYKPGPSSTRNFDLMAQYEDNFAGTQTYYCEGNSMPGWFDQNATQVVDEPDDATNPVAPCWAKVTFDPAPTYQKFYDAPFYDSFVETQTSTEAYKRVMSDVGVQSPVRDDHDMRIVRETLQNTTTYNGSVTGLPGIIDNPDDVGGLEDFPTTTRDASWDADGDGIADWWDGSNGGDDGWTALDGYLNFMSDPHVFVKPSSQVTIDLVPLSAGFVRPSFTVKAGSGSVSVSGTNAIYTAGESSGIDTVTLNIVDSEGSTWSRTIGVAIFDAA